MRRKPILLALLLASGGSAGFTQGVATSPGPDAVSVTVYRDPDRDADRALNLDWLNGYALITETRRVDIPAGDAEIRFEGVAGGIMPESAIVAGLPDGVVEKNQDAQLLSPVSLLDRSLGRRVHLRRTLRATGAVREEEAVIRSGAGGAVVLQTEAGFEALRCTGIPETLVYDRVPEGLSAKPTLSVRTRSTRAVLRSVFLILPAGSTGRRIMSRRSPRPAIVPTCLRGLPWRTAMKPASSMPPPRPSQENQSAKRIPDVSGSRALPCRCNAGRARRPAISDRSHLPHPRRRPRRR
jgi:hypothetical protein